MALASKGASWAVAAGVAAVEALKDQVGLCRWNYAMRSIHQHAKNSISSARNSSSSSKMRKFSSGGGVEQAKGGVAEAAKRAREAEKAENVMHLVCWGPR